MRTIVRFSVDNESNSALRNKLTNVLVRAGFDRGKNTATYEHIHIDQLALAKVLHEFWKRANSHPGTGRLDHFWMYSDRSDIDDLGI